MVSDYLQRAARHISSKTDLDQIYAVGKAAVKFALSGENAVMPIIKRISSSPYSWEIDKVKLSRMANVKKNFPKNLFLKMVLDLLRLARII